MTDPDPVWRARIVARTSRPGWIGWLEEALGPEAKREVPRARARVSASPPDGLTIDVEASDAGAVRAALNTYLGWVELGLATLRTATSPPQPHR